MKILMDCVYTQRPAVCSSSYLMWEIIESYVMARDDVFFYVLYPPHKMQDEDWAFMGRFKDRVTLLPLEQTTSDRVSELHMLRNQLRYYLNPWSRKTWDADVVLTTRIPVLKHMRVHSSRFMGRAMPSQRLYVGLEEMPILPFRETVPWSEFQYPDTLMSYGLADAVVVNHQWLKSNLRAVAREVLSPAWQKRVLENVHEAVPVKLERLKCEKTYDGKEFRLTFVGRITGTRNFGDVAEVMRKAFSYPLGAKQTMQFLISTNSEAAGAGKYGEIDFIDLQMNDRPKFHDFLTRAHAALNLSTVEDFSLSTYETLLAGVPVIIRDHPWNQFLGADYPFRCFNDTEVYAMINAMAENYGQQYERFRLWEATHWKSYVEGPQNITTFEVLSDLIDKFVARRTEHLQGRGGSYVQTVRDVEVVDDKIDLSSVLADTSVMKDDVEDHFSLPLGRVPTSLMLKLIAEQQGWKDTNVCGVMTR